MNRAFCPMLMGMSRARAGSSCRTGTWRVCRGRDACALDGHHHAASWVFSLLWFSLASGPGEIKWANALSNSCPYSSPWLGSWEPLFTQV